MLESFLGVTLQPPSKLPILQAIVDLDQRLERLGKSERLGLVSSRKPRRLVSVSSRTKFSMSWSRLGLGHLGLVSRLGLGVKGLVDIPDCTTAIDKISYRGTIVVQMATKGLVPIY